MIRALLLFSFCSAVGFAQPLGFGIKGGLPLNDLFDTRGGVQASAFNTETKRYIFGPTVELRLPAGFAIEADALYSRAKFSSPLSAAGSLAGSVIDAANWEFPVVAKKKFRGSDVIAASVRPYVEAGASFRRISGIRNLPAFLSGNRGGEVDTQNTGFVAGAGIEFRVLNIRVSPELRWTRWGSGHFTEGLANIFKANRNQAQFLVGLSF